MEESVTFAQLNKRSEQFFRDNRGAKVQTHNNLISKFKAEGDRVADMAARARPLVHEKVVKLMERWIELMKRLGTPDEKKIYRDMTPTALTDRLLCCRPLAFLTRADSWLAKDGRHGAGDWDSTARAELDTFLSYDEIKLAALIQVSCPTKLINSGSRDNVGRNGEMGSYIEEAVYVGAVGARFEMEKRMEYQEVLVTKSQNRETAGYGPRQGGKEDREREVLLLFAKFYKLSHLPTWEEVVGGKTEEHAKVTISGSMEQVYFNKEVYIQRIQLAAETFLMEAESRGQKEGREVYCHAVGLGLGVWQVHPLQQTLYLTGWVRALRRLSLKKVTDLDFSWVARSEELPELQHNNQFEKTAVKIIFSRRDPFAPLSKNDQDKLVVAMFAWDGNSYIGNEFWDGMLSASGDPAAACCSLIPELLNPDINPSMRGASLHVASRSLGLLPYCQYREQGRHPSAAQAPGYRESRLI